MINEKSKSLDVVGVGVLNNVHDRGNWHPHWTIRKYDTPDDIDGSKYGKLSDEEIQALGLMPVEVLELEGNLLLNDGINAIITPAIIGSAITAINATNGCIGIGDSATAASAGQTALQASTNHLWVIITATTGTGASQQLVLAATFSTAQANWVWNEIMAGATTTPGSLPANATTPPATAHVLNRLVVGMGTKVGTATWTVTLTVTFS